MKSYKIIFLGICLLITSISVAQQPADQVEDILKKGIPQSFYGLSVTALSSGKEVIEVNGHKLFTPASTAKLFTSFAALNKLGNDFTFKTTMGYTGKIDSQGNLLGDIIIIGGGDPTLGSKRGSPHGAISDLVQDIKSQIKAVGITCVKGDIIIVDSFRGKPNIPDTWIWEDLGNYYAAGAWSLNLGENIVRITFDDNQQNNSATSIRSIEPFIPRLTYNNEVMTSHPKGKDEAYVFGAPYQYQRAIRGSIPSQKKGFRIKGSMPYPPRDAGNIIKNQLPELFPSAEVRILNQTPEGFQEVHTYESYPLIKIATLANHKSINIYCDAFLRMLSTESDYGSISSGLDYLDSYLSKLNLSENEVKLYDGSGLSPMTKTSPSVLSAYIAHHIKNKNGRTEILPQVGQEGTVKYLLRNQNAAKAFRLKSGSMDHVLTYAGIYKAPSGKQYAIALMANNYTQPYSEVKRTLETVLIYLNSYLSSK